MAERSVLICGASIAGPALAFWLKRHGFRPVIVERAPELRTGGQSVDVRGAGQEVVRRMNLEQAIRARTTHEAGIAFVDSEGREKARISTEALDGKGPTAELEILRGELARVLYDATREDTEYLFGDRVASLTETGDRVRVGFLHGPEREFDLVIAADGIRSKTRELVFGDEARIRSLGLYIAYFTIPREPSDDTWARWYNAPGCRGLVLRPDNVGTTRALLTFLSPPRGYERLGQDEQKDVLRRVFADAGWQVPRALAGLTGTQDFYFEAIGQVRMPRWSRGRVALVGDAAYCASPISGMGTSLALVGAYILAGELSRHESHAEAFAAYERLMRPYVARAQDVPSVAPRLANPRTRAGIALGHTVLRLATAPGVRQLLGRLLTPPAEIISLPDYGVS
ncbi:FAD-dependent monooxygenase [Cystobacter ferrugineus]|uniref:FAD-binding monooxygenase n=1 Tax=Cystobacter ferrugineus TaxID=83449 RepID=A0A1L9B0P1_9BACT|nr:FAD-dependent monooxygenase [Cystobacter ferrugineus]OJH35796.1 FAD-binding monooxygenase [Cystobacter ferrugineus]